MDARGGHLTGPPLPARRRPVRLRLLLLLVTALAGAGCHGAGETTDKIIPAGWKGNGWGPLANAARARGTMPSVPNSPNMDAWDAWGRENLRDGDILFRMGDARAVLGLFPFSKVSAAIAGSRYSHSGIVAIEGGEPVVYDTSTAGPQRQPFPVWVLDTRGSLAVKRPLPEYASCAPGAVDFCRSVYQAQVPFDFDMSLGDDRLYCIELTERAYASAGLPLSKPLRLDELPRYHEFPRIVRLMQLFTKMVPHQLAYVIGNDSIGIWSSPSLRLVYEAPHGRPPLSLVRAPRVGETH
jgi:Permuted papain-like amidase enzyme, YaeF/YiiX, C92 family